MNERKIIKTRKNGAFMIAQVGTKFIPVPLHDEVIDITINDSTKEGVITKIIERYGEVVELDIPMHVPKLEGKKMFLVLWEKCSHILAIYAKSEQEAFEASQEFGALGSIEVVNINEVMYLQAGKSVIENLEDQDLVDGNEFEDKTDETIPCAICEAEHSIVDWKKNENKCPSCGYEEKH